MASNVDPLQTLQAALSVQANSKEQADLLAVLRESLEARPAPIPLLVTPLIGIVVNAADSLMKRWVLDLLHFAISRSSLSIEQRTMMASQTLDTLAQLLDDQKPATVKVVIQCLSTVYPLLFRQMCSNRTNTTAWNTLTTCKNRIIEFVWSPTVNVGVRLSAMKFVQRVILVQTRGISDPRLQNKNDPNIASCPVDHPFISVSKLEGEGQKLLEGLIATLYSSQDVDLLSAMLNSWANLIKLRPAMVPIIVTTLKQWTPAALVGLPASSVKSIEKCIRILLVHITRTPGNSQYAPQINEALSQQGIRMDKAAAEEKKRKAGLLAAAADSKKRPSSVPNEQPADAKRPKLESDTPPSATASFLAAFDFTSLPAPLITELIVANLEAFTESSLVSLVQAYRQSRSLGLAPATPTPVPASIPTPAPAPALGPAPVSAPSASIPTGPRKSAAIPVDDTQAPPPQAVPVVKEEQPVDPLQMDIIDQDELEYEPERLNETLSGGRIAVVEDEMVVPEVDTETNLQIIDFKLPLPKDLPEDRRVELITDSFMRIWDGAKDLRTFGEAIPADSSQAGGNSATEMWMLLLVRMITRVTQPPEDDEIMDDSPKPDGKELAVQDFYSRQDQMRQTLCNYIMADLPSRVRLATTWMNEEWYNDQLRLAKDRNWRPNYDIWLNQIVASYQTLLDAKDRTFARFLLDLPSVPPDVLGLLRDLCVDYSSPERMQVGFTTLRGLVIQRPSMRTEALNVLLELTTHPEKRTRNAAINTVKLWVPNAQPMDSMIREFALQMLRKLQLRPSSSARKVDEDVQMQDGTSENDTAEDAPVVAEASEAPSVEHETVVPKGGEVGEEQEDNMEDGQLPTEDLVHTPYLPERIELPAEKSQVLQHVELLFALCVKVPEFLDEIFDAYGNMDITVQEAIQELITALIKSLGSSHGKLLTLMRTCPAGSESLALRVLTIFTEHGRPSAQLVALVKALVNERDLDARFLIPIIAEMDKPDIMRHLPRIVSLLDGQLETKNLVRSVFSSIVTTPPQTFGSVTSNQPRERQSQLLTPADLMVLLHESEQEVGRKKAKEAIGICFSMTDVFRSEILAVVMQQIVDKPVLPVLFLRTVIQAVTMYKSLVGFVSTTLLSRLITKKIWTTPLLWEGFMHCAKVIAPASFGALLQLPKDQLRELVDKQPSLKSGLRDYVNKKAPNKARVAGFLDIFGEADDGGSSNPPSSPSTPQPDSGAIASPGPL